MKAILKFDCGDKLVVDFLNYPPRKERETWWEYEERIMELFTKGQPKMRHKVVGIHLLRH